MYERMSPLTELVEHLSLISLQDSVLFEILHDLPCLTFILCRAFGACVAPTVLEQRLERKREMKARAIESSKRDLSLSLAYELKRN